jgi:hypothetical protein
MSVIQEENLITVATPSLEILGSEPVPPEIVRDLLRSAWMPTQRLPRPEIHIQDDVTLPGEQVHLARADYILIGETTIEERQAGHRYEYKDIDVTVTIGLYTKHSRQRLYDMMAEVRRIVYTYQRSLRPYQQLYFDSFVEDSSGKHGFWAGSVQIRLTARDVPIITGFSTGSEPQSVPDAETSGFGFSMEDTGAEPTEEPPVPPPTIN